MCYYSDGDCSEVWNEKRIYARAEHSCHDCGDVIGKRDECDRIGSLYDGSWSTLYICARCIFMRAWLYGHEIAYEGCEPRHSMIRIVGDGVIRDEYKRLFREHHAPGEA